MGREETRRRRKRRSRFKRRRGLTTCGRPSNKMWGQRSRPAATVSPPVSPLRQDVCDTVRPSPPSFPVTYNTVYMDVRVDFKLFMSVYTLCMYVWWGAFRGRPGRSIHPPFTQFRSLVILQPCAPHNIQNLYLPPPPFKSLYTAHCYVHFSFPRVINTCSNYDRLRGR